MDVIIIYFWCWSIEGKKSSANCSKWIKNVERFVNLVVFVVVKSSLIRTVWGSKISSRATNSGLDWGLNSTAPGHCSFKAIPVWLWLYMLRSVWWKNKSSRSRLKQILQDFFIFYRIPFTLYPHKPAVDKHPHQTSWWGRCVTSRPYSCGWWN